MRETLKTVLLVLLVAASLIQSFMLTYGERQFEPEQTNEYVETERIGTAKEAIELVHPQSIVIHLGGNEHTVMYPGMTFYRMILETVRERSFDAFQVVPLSELDRVKMSTEQKGIEIRYKESLPIPVLARTMQLKPSFSMEQSRIERIWLLVDEEQQEVTALFMDDNDRIAYSSGRTGLAVKDIEQLVTFGEFLLRYDMLESGSGIYLPREPLETAEYVYILEAMEPEQLQKSLFVNPDITRSIQEWDGTEIYTDGKRGLKISSDRRWMTYSDPVAPVENLQDETGDILTAVQFVNQHGGWNGAYTLSRLSNQTASIIRFTQYIEDMPVLSGFPGPFGYIELEMNNGIVTRYERPLLRVRDTLMDRKARTLPGGELLKEKVASISGAGVIEEVYPALQPTVAENQVRFTPVWAAQTTDGTTYRLDIR